MIMNVSTKKVVIVVVTIVVIAFGVVLYIDSAPKRKANAEIKTMIDYVQKQALEIAIIEQSSKLAGYRKQLADQQKPIEPNPLLPKVAPVLTETK